MPAAGSSGGAMDENTVDGGWCLIDRHRDMYLRCRARDKPVKFGGRLVAEHGAGSGTQHGRPEKTGPGQGTAEGGVDAAVDPLPAPRFEMAADALVRHSTVEGLSPGHNAGLCGGDIGQVLVIPPSHSSM